MKTKKTKGVYPPVVGFSECDYSTALNLKGEEWKEILIPALDGNYEASNLGRVRRKSHDCCYEVKGYQAVKYLKAKILRCVIDKYGYLRITFKKRGSYFVHRLIASAWFGNSNLQIDHLNGNKHDNRVCNLEYVTGLENMRRAWRNGQITPSGQCEHLKAFSVPKFNKEQVEEIRRLYKPHKYTINTLAAQFNTCERTIRDILKRKKAYKNI